MQLIFATNNTNKLREIRQILGASFFIQGLKEAGIDVDIPENEPTLEGNARFKAQTIYQLTGMPVFADDTGLEVEALNGAPGVYSARYAGEHGNAEANMDKLLNALKETHSRLAQFRTIISLIFNDKSYTFEGVCKGEIALEKSGVEGFGYDPIFIPEGYSKTFAELDPTTKNQISHRGKATQKLVDFLISKQ